MRQGADSRWILRFVRAGLAGREQRGLNQKPNFWNNRIGSVHVGMGSRRAHHRRNLRVRTLELPGGKQGLPELPHGF